MPRLCGAGERLGAIVYLAVHVSILKPLRQQATDRFHVVAVERLRPLLLLLEQHFLVASLPCWTRCSRCQHHETCQPGKEDNRHSHHALWVHQGTIITRRYASVAVGTP